MGKLITLEVSEWLMKTIDSGLQNLPYREAAPAIGEINRQIQSQMPTSDGSVSKLPDASDTGKP